MLGMWAGGLRQSCQALQGFNDDVTLGFGPVASFFQKGRVRCDALLGGGDQERERLVRSVAAMIVDPMEKIGCFVKGVADFEERIGVRIEVDPGFRTTG